MIWHTINTLTATLTQCSCPLSSSGTYLIPTITQSHTLSLINPKHTAQCIHQTDTRSFAFPWAKKTKKVLLWLRKPTFTTLFLPDTNSHTNTSVAHCCFSYPHLLRHTKTQTTVIKIKSYIHERLFFADRSRDREQLGPIRTEGKQSITLCMMCIDERENVIRTLSAVMLK